MTHSDRTQAKLSITVAALTRRRPDMLQDLLTSWGQMELPDNTELRCLIVENDTETRSADTVARNAPLPNGLALDHVLETEPGIPFARNRAAREAIANGDDLLTFVDDDETVARDWLVQLVHAYRNGTARLIGGPSFVSDRIDPSATMMERVMHNSLQGHIALIVRQKSARGTFSTTPKINVFTHNWLGETSLFSEEDIWFDENMRFTGGTDSKFSTDVKERGLDVGWAGDAHAFETVPRERLNFFYQHRRARDQINNLFHRQMAEDPSARYRLILQLPGKCLSILLTALRVPATRGRTLYKLAKRTGWVTGRVSAALGRRSSLYKKAGED